MVVKSSREDVMIAAAVAIVYLWFIISILGADIVTGDVVSLGVAFILVIMCSRHLLLTLRTIVMDEKGCTVRILRYRKFYAWDALKVKRIDLNTAVCNGHYTECAIFSVKNVHKPRRWDPDFYNECCPFSLSTFFYVYFTPNHKKLSKKDSCAVEKHEFMEKMEEWHVALTVNDKKLWGWY